jgi:EAL domain-containing protein (putative c-di-GMP-specific phosphodiesterase class I)/DNA-binding NarL/FixJ family response regulator
MLNLLFVEDNPQARESMSIILQAFFGNIITAVDGEDGFNKFKNNKIDIVITDINMPKQNGIEMMKRIRRIDSNIPIVVISASDDKEYLMNSIKSGVQDYILKPVVMDELLSTINRVIKKINDDSLKNRIIKKYQKSVQLKEELISVLNGIDESIVVLLKIEDFKYLYNYMDENINDSMQREFAEKLLYLIPKECNFSKIYHIDDGEFVLTKPKSKCKYIDDIENHIVELQNRINSAKINVGYVDYDLSVIISVAYGRSALLDAKVGIRKLLKSNGSFIFSNGLHKELEKVSKNKIETFRMIRKAIDSSNVVSYFQPIINNQTKQVEKHESLVRLIDDNGKVLSPYFFLEASKKGKYYSQITSIVLQNSFDALKYTDTNISINLSTLDIEKKQTREEFFGLLSENLPYATRVVLELVESENCSSFNIVQKFLKDIKKLGVKIAIDDFGVGYSNFERVLDYNPDFLKIDGRLIKNIDIDKISYSIVEAIVSFAKKENLRTIAEFVETKEIYDTICKIGVDYSQGYYFGKPDRLL